MTVPALSGSLASQTNSIVTAVAFYWIVSTFVTFSNKTLLSGWDLVHVPLFHTWFQCFVTVIFCFVAGTSGILNVPKFEIKKDVALQMLPLTAVFTCTDFINEFTMRYFSTIPISDLYWAQTLSRSSIFLFVVIFEYAILRQVTSLPAMGCWVALWSGVLIGDIQEARWSISVVFSGVASVVLLALNVIYFKEKIVLVENNVWKITLYNNLNAAIVLFPLLVFSGNLKSVLASRSASKMYSWGVLTLNALLGVLFSFTGAAQIKYTSPLTHIVSITAKRVLQSVLPDLLFGYPITYLGFVSVLVVLPGSLMYTLIRIVEMKRKVAAAVDAGSNPV